MTFNLRFFPTVLRARQLIDSGFLGRIFSSRALLSFQLHQPRQTTFLALAQRRFGGRRTL